MQLIYRNVEESIVEEIGKKLNGLIHASNLVLPEKLILFQANNESDSERIKIRETLLAFQAPIIIFSKADSVSKLAWKMDAAYFVDMDAKDWQNDLRTGFKYFLSKSTALYVQKVFIPSIKNKDFINPNHVIYIKADRNYSEIVLTDKSKILVSKNLSEVEKLFSEFDFIERFGKSIIINLNNIKSIQTKKIEFINNEVFEFPKYNAQFPYLIKRLTWKIAKVNY